MTPTLSRLVRSIVPAVILAAIVRIAYLAQLYDTPLFLVMRADAQEFHEIALSLARGQIHYAFPFRPPLYPLLLSIVYIALGVSRLVPLLLQVGGGLFAVSLVHRIAERLYGATAGFVAGLGAALCGMMIISDLEPMPTALEALLVLIAVWESIEFENRPRNPIAAGVAIGLAALTRPTMLLLYLPFGWWFGRGSGSRRQLPQFLMAAIVPLVLSLGFHLVTGTGAIPIAAQGGINFYIGNSPESDGSSPNFPGIGTGWNWDTVVRTAEVQSGEKMSPSSADRYYWWKGVREITDDFPGATMRYCRKLLLFWNHSEIPNDRDIAYQAVRYPILKPFIWIGVPLLFPLGLVGFWAERRRREAQLLVGIILIYWVGVSLFFVNARFRHPLIPLLIIFAAGGVAEIARQVRERLPLKAWLSNGVLPALAIGVIIPFSMRIESADALYYGKFTEAIALEKLGRTEEASALYRDILQAKPRTPFVNSKLGRIAADRSDLAEAIRYYEVELCIQPRYGTAWKALGDLQQQVGDDEAALKCYDTALEFRPELADAATAAAIIRKRLNARADASNSKNLQGGSMIPLKQVP